jgi:hypothetical protein
MRLGWLVEAAAETGYPVVVVDGWEDRGLSSDYNPSTVVAHHTAGPSGSGDMPSLGIIVNGRSDLPGPLANYGLGRSGTVYVVASGKANNAGEGSWKGCSSNYCTVGIEAENDGSQPWPDVQLDSYVRLSVAILERLGVDETRLCGHKEWSPGRKVDPHHLDMNRARSIVSDILSGDMPLTDEEIERIAQRAAELVWAQPVSVPQGGTKPYGWVVGQSYGLDQRTVAASEKAVDLLESENPS